MSKNVKTISQKIAELDSAVEWFYGDEFSLDQATEKYRAAVTLANEIKSDLDNLKNDVRIVEKDFSQK